MPGSMSLSTGDKAITLSTAEIEAIIPQMGSNVGKARVFITDHATQSPNIIMISPI